jgi:hypothetical protein
VPREFAADWRVRSSAGIYAVWNLPILRAMHRRGLFAGLKPGAYR